MRVEVPEYQTYVDFPDGIDPTEVERLLGETFPAKTPPAPPAPAAPAISTLPAHQERLSYLPPQEPTIGTPVPSPMAALNQPGAVRSTPVGPGMPTEPPRGGTAATGLLGAAEGAAAVGTGAVTFPAGVIAGAGRAAVGMAGGESPVEALSAGSDLLERAMQKGYLPKTPEGEKSVPGMIIGVPAAITAIAGGPVIAAAAAGASFLALDKLVTDLSDRPEFTDKDKKAIKMAFYVTISAAPGASKIVQKGIYRSMAKLSRIETGMPYDYEGTLQRDAYQAYQRVRTPESNPARLLPGSTEPTMAKEAGPGPAPAPPSGAPPARGVSIPNTPPVATPEATATIPPKPPGPQSPAALPAPEHAPLRRGAEVDIEKFKETLKAQGVDPESPAGREIIKAHSANIESRSTDKATGFQTRTEYETAMPHIGERAAKGQNISYTEFDMPGTKLQNAALTRPGVDKHFNAKFAIIRDTIRETIPDAQFFRNGGDEGQVVSGAPKEVQDRAMMEAARRVTEYDKANGLNKIYKQPNGLYHATERLNDFQAEPGMDAWEIAVFKANNRIEAIKVTRKGGGEHGGPIEKAGTVPPQEPAGPIAEGAQGANKVGERAPKKPTGPSALPGVRSAEQSIGPDRIARLSESQINWLQGLSETLGGAEAKKFLSQKAGQDEAIGWTGGGFDHVREIFDLPSDFAFNKELDLRAIRKALEGKKLGRAEIDRINTFLSAHYDRTMRESDIISTEPVEEGVPFDRGGYKLGAKKEKPVQQDLGLGTTGKDLKAPKKEGTKAAEDSPLFEDVKRRKDAENQGELFDQGGYDLSMKEAGLELPELTKLAKELLGKYPKVKPGMMTRIVGGAVRQILGKFQVKKGDILLSGDIAKVQELAEAVLAHETGHVKSIAVGSKKTLDRGNILGKIKSSVVPYLKDTLEAYPGAPGTVLTAEDRARFKAQAAEMAKSERDAREGGKAVPGEYAVSPADILAIWNDVAAREKNKPLYDHIVSLSETEKRRIVKDAMKGISNVTLRQQIEKGNYVDLTARQKEIYQDLIRQEIIKRGLYEKETIMDELKALTQRVKPFDTEASPEFTRYAYAPEELYANGVGAMLTRPGLLEEVAPTFRKAILNWMSEKPEFKTAWEAIQKDYRENSVDRQRMADEYAMYKRGHELRNKMAKERGDVRASGESLRDWFMRGLVEKYHDAYKVFNFLEAKKSQRSVSAKKAKDAFEEIPFLMGMQNEILRQLKEGVLDPAEKAGITQDDLSAYMRHTRVAEEKRGQFEPLGHTASTSKDFLKTLKDTWGAEKYNKVKEISDWYMDFRQEVMIPMFEKGGTWTPELIEFAKNAQYYVKTSVQDYLEGQYGSAGSSKVYRKVGTVQEMENAFVATVLQDLGIARATRINQAKQALVKAFKQAQPDLPSIWDARMEFDANRQGMAPKEPATLRKAELDEMGIPQGSKLDTLTVLYDGKMKHYYVSDKIVEAFHRKPVEAVKFVEFMNHFNIPMKELMVSKNIGWQLRNPVRDIMATVKNTPMVRLRDIPKLINVYRKTAREVWREAHHKGRSEDISRMLTEGTLSPRRTYGSHEIEFETELDRQMDQFFLEHTEDVQSSKAKKAIKRAWDWLDEAGYFSDAWGKVAGDRYVQKYHPEMKGYERRRLIRNRLATPNYMRRGEWQAITNSLSLFSNVNKEGMRAGWESYKEDPSSYMWKVFWMNVFPKIMLWGASIGLLGKQYQDVTDKIPEYDKRQYNVVPLYVNSKGKAAYLRIPVDYEGQFFSGLAHNMLNAKFIGMGSASEVALNLNPYRIHPLINIATSLVQYYVNDQIPKSSFRGEPIMTEDQKKSGGLDAAGPLARNAWNEVGMSAVYQFKPNTVEKDRDAIDKALSVWPFNGLGSYYKESNQGEREQLREDVTGPVRKEQAKRHIAMKDAIIDSINENKGGDREKAIADLYVKMRSDGQLEPDAKYKQFRARYNRYASRAADNPRVDAFINAATAEEKAGLLKNYRESLSAEQYDAIFKQLAAEGYIKKSTMLHLNRPR